MFCRSFASGLGDRSSDPSGMSSAETFTSELSDPVDNFIRFLDVTFLAAEGCAQSGTEFSRSN